MTLFDSKHFTQVLDGEIKKYINENRVEKTLLIIQIGENSASQKYIQLKKKLCDGFKIPCELVELDQNLSDENLRSEVTKLVSRSDVGGCIIQLPLPRQSLYPILDLLPSEKDIDCLSYNLGDRLSPVVRAFDLFLQLVKPKKLYVIGQGRVVGKPISVFAKSIGIEVSVSENYVRGEKINDFDVVVLSAGIPNLVNPKDISAGTSVVDFGSSVIENKVVGDLDVSGDLSHLGLVAPSPGGLGPLVVRFLIMNFLGI